MGTLTETPDASVSLRKGLIHFTNLKGRKVGTELSCLLVHFSDACSPLGSQGHDPAPPVGSWWVCAHRKLACRVEPGNMSFTRPASPALLCGHFLFHFLAFLGNTEVTASW